MKKGKITKPVKKQEILMESEEYSAKKLLKIIVTLVIIFGVFYLITTFVVKPITNDKTETPTVTDFDFTKITLNHLLDRKENEYFVIATKKSNGSLVNSSANYKIIYNNYINDYKKQEEALTFYNVDLDDAFNKNYLGETNISNDLSELKLNEDVLFKIKNGKIKEHYIGSSEIIKALSKLTEK